MNTLNYFPYFHLKMAKARSRIWTFCDRDGLASGRKSGTGSPRGEKAQGWELALDLKRSKAGPESGPSLLGGARRDSGSLLAFPSPQGTHSLSPFFACKIYIVHRPVF